MWKVQIIEPPEPASASTGGTKETAIRSLDEAGVTDAVVQALLAAQKRSLELSK
jgi:pyrroline-5-carboxylate reductase